MCKHSPCCTRLMKLPVCLLWPLLVRWHRFLLRLRPVPHHHCHP